MNSMAINSTAMNPTMMSPVTSPLSKAPLLNSATVAEKGSAAEGKDDTEVRKAFDQFVGETFFSQMLSSMRSMTDKSAYFHGGRGEEVFQKQLDQMLAQKMSENSADTFTGPMFELFSLQRR